MRTWILVCLIIASHIGYAQSFRSLNNEGVEQYKNKKYQDAEIQFRKGIGTDSANFKGYFNLGDSYFRQGKNDEAISSFKKSIEKSSSKEEKASGYYNLGNALMKSEKYQESVDAYKSSLKANPKDKDAKYNLAYALSRLKQQQQQQNKDNKDNKKDQNKDQNKKDQDKKDQDKKDQDKKEQDKKDQDKQDQNKDKQDQQKQDKQQQNGQQPKIKKEDAERMLEALKNNEKDLQKKLKKKVGVRAKSDKDW